MSTQDKVIAIIAEQAVLEPSDVALDSTLEDLGIDSLGLVESIFAIEEEFDITIPFNANEPEKSEFDISNVAAIIAGIEKLIAENDRGSVRRGLSMKLVITGMGTINALGHTVAETMTSLAEGRCGIGELDFQDVDRLSIR
eukprot:CAMPEP_0195259332 /NCGR_PEP_ID=MMETSP0706-20130129/7896_1 /TAXON_ID=33640 /ORGANISM="Asterionellopsis glacialis, Strain CCMP134" /LENGTH=140 /DNA_ID=CAMNT_0040312801 /DNA_START=77 /DNA_END=497 /DNA_ORIENTATION=-